MLRAAIVTQSVYHGLKLAYSYSLFITVGIVLKVYSATPTTAFDNRIAPCQLPLYKKQFNSIQA
jgi:hypothetical protein